MIKRIHRGLFCITVSLLIVLFISTLVMWSIYGIGWAVVFTLCGVIVSLPLFMLFSLVNLYVTYHAVYRDVMQEKEV